ncbi:hypothetical protein NL511_29115, partial [Klebsiella pneumoniae]|nr:hypothetical protein [Klebsiella pneumoniae]
ATAPLCGASETRTDVARSRKLSEIQNKKTAFHRCFFVGWVFRLLLGLIGLLPLAMYQPDQVA